MGAMLAFGLEVHVSMRHAAVQRLIHFNPSACDPFLWLVQGVTDMRLSLLSSLSAVHGQLLFDNSD